MSNVTDLSNLFKYAQMFNEPLANWNISRVTNMSFMFSEAECFNQPLNDLDVSNVTDMSSMFAGAESFNQPLKDWNVGNGIIAEVGSQIRSDSYKVYQDPSANDIQSFNPSGSIGIKWPIISKKKKNTHFIEPKIQFIASDNGKNLIPNEDSLLPEFDETNLFEFSRFPGVDSYEKGKRVNLGVNYTYERFKSFKTIFKIGKILRNKNENQFSNSTGLNGKSSDWLTSSQLNIGPKFALTNRSLLKDDLSIL